jgi:protein SCO1
MKSGYLLLLLLLSLGGGARAELTSGELAAVSLTPPPNAAVPLGLLFERAGGGAVTLSQALDHRPTVLLFVDYTCRTICGPALAIAASALADTGLKPAQDFRLVVVGLDEKDTAKDALAMSAHLLSLEVKSATEILRGSRRSVENLTRAVGYRYSYDGAVDQFAHPAGVVVLTPEGHVSRVLSSLALNSSDLRLALVEAGNGRIGSVGDHLRLLCYGFDAVHGVYSLAISRALQLLGVLTAFALFALMVCASRRRMTAGIR